MGYHITIQSNPHDTDRPSYAEGETPNVVNLHIPDDGPEAERLHELIGIAVARGESLHAEEADELLGRIRDLRNRGREDNPKKPEDAPDVTK